MIWTVSTMDLTCGGCNAAIPPNQPIATFTNARKIRCVACADRLGFPVDHEQVDLERFRLERERLQAAPTTVNAGLPAPAPYYHRPRRPHSLAELVENLKLFDPKAAALGDRDR